MMNHSENIRSINIIAHVDAGKCFKKGTQITLSNGEIKSVESLSFNDSVIGLDYQPKKIIEIHSGKGALYTVFQTNGSDYVVNGNHILVLKNKNEVNSSDKDIIEISVNDYLQSSDVKKSTLYGFKQSPEQTNDELSEIYVEKETDEGDYVGFQIEGDGKFLWSDFTVMHNSTLTDAFIARAGLMNEEDAGTRRFTDGRVDEAERGITIKSTGVTMDLRFENVDYKINLVDTPGHIDFSSEVSSAIRITDGAVVVVDAIEGVAVQTETVLRQALMEQVKPILLINKMDRYIFELQITPEEAYNRIISIINQVNDIISTYQPKDSELNLKLSPELGNVFWGSALHGWGFGLRNFAKRLSEKYKMSEETLMNKLWGEHYVDPDTKKITTESYKNGKPSERTFCKFVLGPIFQLVDAIMTKQVDKYTPMLKSIGVSLNTKDAEKSGKDMYKVVMKQFLPIAESLLYGIVHHLPSPQQAQRYRYTTLYDGPLDDECALAIKNCDPNGPLMIYISKMIPAENGGRFYAFGRIFSGTVQTGQKVRIFGSSYKHGSKEDVFENKPIQRVAKMIGNKAETCESIQCGNTVALVGIDQYVVKACTITTHPDAHPIKQ